MKDYKFLGTPAPWYPVEYSGFWDIQDAPFYNAKRITSYDEDVFEGTAVTEKVAKANVTLIAAAPLLLEACIDGLKLIEKCYHNDTLPHSQYVQYAEPMKQAIEKALNIKK